MSRASHPLREALTARWAALASRERLFVGAALALMAAAILWWLGIAPALVQLRHTRAAEPQVEAQLQAMRALASEATTLKSQRALSYEESVRGLEASLKTLGTGATLSIVEGRASLTLRGVSADALAQWLAQVRANARLVPTELRLKKAPATPNAAATAASNAATQAATNWDGAIVLNLPAR